MFSPSQQPGSPMWAQSKPPEVPPSPHNTLFKREFVESLNEYVMRDVFFDLLRKAYRKNGDQRATNQMKKFIPLKNIKVYFDASGKRSGGWDHTEKELSLNRAELLHDEEKITKTGSLAIILHEELHAVTTGATTAVNEYEHKVKIGLQDEIFDPITKQSIDKVWKDFNEGITELIKDDILHEYVRRTGDRKLFSLISFEQTKKDVSNYQTYFNERVLVNSIFMRVAKILELPLDVVREAFVQAYLTGEEYVDIEEKKEENQNLGEMMYEIGGDTLLKRMKSESSEELQHNVAIMRENYTRSNQPKNEKEAREYAEEFVVMMCTNFLRKSLV